MDFDDVIILASIALLVVGLTAMVVFIPNPRMEHCATLDGQLESNFEDRMRLASDGLDNTSEYTVLEIEYERLERSYAQECRR